MSFVTSDPQDRSHIPVNNDDDQDREQVMLSPQDIADRQLSWRDVVAGWLFAASFFCLVAFVLAASVHPFTEQARSEVLHPTSNMSHAVLVQRWVHVEREPE
ncbi:MAG: hypothetical protein AB7E70_05645 [Hyphomicrobiaceae bacterium]